MLLLQSIIRNHTVIHTYQGQLKVALPDRQLQGIHLDDLFKVNGSESRERHFDQDRRHPQKQVGVRALGEEIFGIAPNGFAEEQDAKDECRQRPPLGPGVLSLEEDGGETGRGQYFALGKDGEHAGANVAEGNETENVHGSVNERQSDHFSALLDEIIQAGEGRVGGCCFLFVVQQAPVYHVGREEQFDDFPREQNFVFGIVLAQNALTVAPQYRKEGILQRQDDQDHDFGAVGPA